MDEDPLAVLTRSVRALVALARQRGYVTYDEVEAALPPGMAPPELVEDTMAMLNDLGIPVLARAPDS